ncbi:MAG TPA: carboxypeptidase-like regulatory domain-containing protein [Thermoanaerobaculia bacterium]
MRPISLAIALLLSVTATVADGAELAVRLRPAAGNIPPGATVVFRSASGDGRQVATVAEDGSATADLAAGVWTIQVVGDRLWSPERVVTVDGDTAIELETWPSATVTTRIVGLADRAAPPSMRFERAREGAEPLRAEATCSFAEGMLRCSVPAGTLDLRVGAPGSIAQYFPGRRAMPGATVELGLVELRPGQSIYGRVDARTLPEQARKRITVRAVPVRASASPAPPDGLTVLHAVVEKNGVFHIDGVPPGLYHVSASSGAGFAAETYEVPVRTGAETQLQDTLVLRRLRSVAVTVSPALSPAGRPWHVALDRVIRRGQLLPVTESAADASGTWTAPRLQPAEYAVSVSDGPAGSVWHREEVAIGAADAALHVHIAARAVEGSVRLGERPLQARLTFENDAGHSIKGESGDDGTFELLLPGRSDLRWTATVESETPFVKRMLEVAVAEGGEGKRLVIDIPAATLTGRVVDDRGAPVAHALVTVVKSGGEEPTSQLSAGVDGKFDVHGLADATYELSAEGREGRSDSMRIAFVAGRIEPPVELVVKPVRTVMGKVVSRTGLAIGGARVLVLPTDVPAPLLYPVTTAADGTFTATLPPGCREMDVVVAAPGYVYTLDHAVLRPGPMLVRVEERGGTLRLRFRSQGATVFLVQEGAIITPSTVLMLWPGQTRAREDGSEEVTLPAMEPGPYRVCAVAAAEVDMFQATRGARGGRCASGFLAADGELTLDLAQGE